MPKLQLKKKLVLKKRTIVKPSQLGIPDDYSLLGTGTTQGLIMTFLKCRRMFLYAIHRMHSSKKSLTPFFGSFGHEMLESWYKTGKYNIATYSNKEFTVDKQLMEFSKAKMTAVMDNYTRIYKSDKFTNVELEFNFLDSSGFFRRRGKIDAITASTNNKLLVDHKFKGKINEDEISAKLVFDFQMLFYITAYEMYTGKRIAGVLYNIIRNPGHRQGKSETLRAFTKRLSTEIKKDPDHFFMRFECKFTGDDKARFNKELLYKVQDMQKVLTGELSPYKNESSCSSSWGACKFLKACSSDSLDGYKKIKTFFPELEEGK